MNIKLDEELKTEYRKEVQAKLIEAVVSHRFHELLAQKMMLLPDQNAAQDSARARMAMHASKMQSEVLERMLEEIEEASPEEAKSPERATEEGEPVFEGSALEKRMRAIEDAEAEEIKEINAWLNRKKEGEEGCPSSNILKMNSPTSQE